MKKGIKDHRHHIGGHIGDTAAGLYLCTELPEIEERTEDREVVSGIRQRDEGLRGRKLSCSVQKGQRK
jgi:hypothetical protein